MLKCWSWHKRMCKVWNRTISLTTCFLKKNNVFASSNWISKMFILMDFLILFASSEVCLPLSYRLPIDSTWSTFHHVRRRGDVRRHKRRGGHRRGSRRHRVHRGGNCSPSAPTTVRHAVVVYSTLSWRRSSQQEDITLRLTLTLKWKKRLHVD